MGRGWGWQGMRWVAALLGGGVKLGGSNARANEDMKKKVASLKYETLIQLGMRKMTWLKKGTGPGARMRRQGRMLKRSCLSLA